MIPPFAIFGVGAVLAVIFGVCLAATQGCLHVGRAISTTGSKTGFQDAVSPPLLAKAIWGLLALLLVIVAFSFWEAGPGIGGLLIVVLMAANILGTKMAPEPASPRWVRMIYGSLSRRAANYAKQNDRMRAEAATSLVKLIENRFADDLTVR